MEKQNSSESDKEDGKEIEEMSAVEQKSRTRTVSGSSDTSVSTDKQKRQFIAIPSLTQHDGFLFPSVPASPPKFISLEQIMEAANGVSNMALAHEIAVNKEFLLEKVGPETGIEKQVKEVVHKAFWDAFEAQLKDDPPNYSHALILLTEIKEALMGILLPHHNRLRSQIDEVLDLELIRQQVDNDALDFHYYAKFIVSTMSRLCAPVRDEKIRELGTMTEIVSLYKGILETLELMKLDMANFTIQQMRPHIQQHSVEYERKKFQEILETLSALIPPVDGLELTKKWLLKAYDKMVATHSPKDSQACTTQEPPNPVVIVKAYLEILQWNDDAIFPEALQMDQVRFLALRDQFSTAVLASSLLLVTYSIVGEAIQGIASLKLRLKEDLFILLKDMPVTSAEQLMKDRLEGIGLQVIKEVNNCLKEHGYNELDRTKENVLLAQIKEIGSENHSVRKLINARVFEFVEEILNSTNAASVKFPPGLSAVHKDLSGLAGQFLRLVNHNRAVFGEYYTDIITNIKRQRDQLLKHDT